MASYGTLTASEGSGLLPWSWAEERLISSRNYWMVTVWPDGRPHGLPVWGMWHDGAFWFSSRKPSRKSKNLGANPRCFVTTVCALNPGVVRGHSRLVCDRVGMPK